MRALLTTALLACGHGPSAQPAPVGSGSPGPAVTPVPAPSAAPGPHTARIVDLAMVERLVCALRDDGHARCWGYRYRGHDVPSSAVPVQLPGIDHAVAIDLELDGLVRATNADGTIVQTNVGDFSQIEQAWPLAGVADIARTYHDTALTRSGAVVDLGTKQPIAGLDHVTQMVHGISIDGAGRVWYGSKPSDVLDGAHVLGEIVQRQTGELVTWSGFEGVQPVTDLPATLTAWAGGGTATCIIDGGVVKCRGDNRFGELGRPGAASKDLVPVTLPAPATLLVAGMRSFCAVAGGELYCWGANDGGQLGDGTLRDRDTPVHVVGATSATPPARIDGFDDPQTGPPFDWSGLPRDCKRPADMVDEWGHVALTSVVSAYAFRDDGRTSVALADFAMDPRGYQTSYSMRPTRGRQKAIEVELERGSEHHGKPVDVGAYGMHTKARFAIVASFRGDYTTDGWWSDDPGTDIRATVAHLDASWICGDVTVKSGALTATRPFAARVVPPYPAR